MSSSRLPLLLGVVLFGAAGYIAFQLFGSGDDDSGARAPDDLPAVAAPAPGAPELQDPAAAASDAAAADAPSPTQKEEAAAPNADDPEVSGRGGISGLVRAGPGGAPLADVEIALAVGSGVTGLQWPGLRRMTDFRAKTGADGTYRFEALPTAADYIVVARHADFAETELGGIAVRPDDVTLVPDLPLRLGTKVAGLVTDRDSAPVANATVELWNVMDKASASDGEAPPWRVTTTDEGGNYAFANLHFPSIELVVRAEGFAPQRKASHSLFAVSSSDRAVDFVLLKPWSLSGSVVDGNGNGIEAVRVVAEQVNIAPDVGAAFGTVTTGPGGAFALDGLVEGAFQLVARAPGYSDSAAVTAEAGTTDARIVLEPRGGLEVTVRANGGAAPPAQLLLELRVAPEDGPVGGALKSTPARLADGKFEWRDLEPGRFCVAALAQGFATSLSEPLVIERGAITRGVTVVLRQGGGLTGRVAAADGTPLAGARVRINPPGSIANAMVEKLEISMRQGRKVRPESRTKADGTFTFANLDPGAHQVEVAAQGFARKVLEGVKVAEGQVADTGTIAVARGGSITGRALDERGEILSACTVTCSGKAAGYYEMMRPDSDGRFEFANLIAGEYELRIVPEARPGVAGGEGALGGLLGALKSVQTVAVRDGVPSKVTVALPPPQ